MKGNFLKAELVCLGLQSKQIIEILREEYGVTAHVSEISRAISGSGKYPKHDQIRAKLWDYIGKHRVQR